MHSPKFSNCFVGEAIKWLLHCFQSFIPPLNHSDDQDGPVMGQCNTKWSRIASKSEKKIALILCTNNSTKSLSKRQVHGAKVFYRRPENTLYYPIKIRTLTIMLTLQRAIMEA